MRASSRPTLLRSVWVPALTLLLAVLVIGASIRANAWKHGFRVAHVRAEGNAIVADSELVRLAGIPRNAGLFDVDLGPARARVLGNPYMATAALGREIPDAIVITVTERVPVAALVMERTLYVDDAGIVLPALPAVRALDLPVITGAVLPAECTPGQRLRSRGAREAVDILATAREIGQDFYHLISEVHCLPDTTCVLTTADAGVPVVFGRGDIAPKLMELEGFWRQVVVQRGAAHLKSVDLRFADQVVARWDAGASPGME